MLLISSPTIFEKIVDTVRGNWGWLNFFLKAIGVLCRGLSVEMTIVVPCFSKIMMHWSIFAPSGWCLQHSMLSWKGTKVIKVSLLWHACYLSCSLWWCKRIWQTTLLQRLLDGIPFSITLVPRTSVVRVTSHQNCFRLILC